MFVLECLHEHVPVFLDLVKSRNSGLLEQLTVTNYEYHSEVVWNIPKQLANGVSGFLSIDMSDSLLLLAYMDGVHTLRVHMQSDSQYITDLCNYINQNFEVITCNNKKAKAIPPYDWQEQLLRHKTKLLLDMTG